MKTCNKRVTFRSVMWGHYFIIYSHCFWELLKCIPDFLCFFFFFQETQACVFHRLLLTFSWLYFFSKKVTHESEDYWTQLEHFSWLLYINILYSVTIVKGIGSYSNTKPKMIIPIDLNAKHLSNQCFMCQNSLISLNKSNFQDCVIAV